MTDELDEIREKEEANYRVSVGLLGDSVSLVQDLVDLHKVLTKTASKSKTVVKDEHITGLHFLLAVRYHLTIGSVAALRAHTSDALRSGRMAIEAAAFAARVKSQPELAMAWLNAAQDDEAYVRYRRIFSGQKMFPEADAVLHELGQRFETTSKLSHPSIYALAEHVRIVKTETGLNVEFHYFPVKKGDPSEPTRTFLWTIDTHFGALRVFVDVLAETLESERKAIDLRMNAVDAKLAVHKGRWKDVILRKPDKPTPDPSGLIIIPPF